jgi:UDP-N-acetylglucosamine transferase subunit ALG13
MIFVTVGTHTQSFNRLLKAVDELIAKGKIKEEVIMQIGYSTYEPKHARWFRFTTHDEIEKLNKEARIIITHGGAGSILTALKYKKPTIVIPRLKKFDEHTDDHQLDLVKTLEKEGKVIGVYDIKDLELAIKEVKITTYKQTRRALIEEIKNFLDNVTKGL